MDRIELGRRLAEARELAGMTQEGVARKVGLDRTAIVLLEKGGRNLKVPELVRIAQVLQRPLSYFVEPAVPAAVSRRSSPGSIHDSTKALDVEIDQFAADVRTLLQLSLLSPLARQEGARVPRTHNEAESAARRYRRELKSGEGPLNDLGRACERLGLLSFAARLGESGPDGGCVEVQHGKNALGVAVINGEAKSGRRRMTLAHELGHWLFGDAYDSEASLDAEAMINSFAIHFLAPRAGVEKLWREHADQPLHERALFVGVAFKLSWSATTSQLRNLDLITHPEREALNDFVPVSGDYLRLGLSWSDELKSPYLSPSFIAACLAGYTESMLTQDRTMELLRGVIRTEDLPAVPKDDTHHLRRSFEGHDFSASRRG